MNCRNCGAVMKVVRDGDYLACEYCGSFYFPKPSRDGVRELGEKSGLQCPVCRGNLVSAALPGSEVLQGEKCKGLLIGQRELREAVEYLRAGASGPPDIPKAMNPEELKRKIQCPCCGKAMDTHAYSGPGNIVVDLCPDCRVVWLDSGKLGRIINAPGRDRGAYR